MILLIKDKVGQEVVLDVITIEHLEEINADSSRNRVKIVTDDLREDILDLNQSTVEILPWR